MIMTDGQLRPAIYWRYWFERNIIFEKMNKKWWMDGCGHYELKETRLYRQWHNWSTYMERDNCLLGSLTWSCSHSIWNAGGIRKRFRVVHHPIGCSRPSPIGYLLGASHLDNWMSNWCEMQIFFYLLIYSNVRIITTAREQSLKLIKSWGLFKQHKQQLPTTTERQLLNIFGNSLWRPPKALVRATNCCLSSKEINHKHVDKFSDIICL